MGQANTHYKDLSGNFLLRAHKLGRASVDKLEPWRTSHHWAAPEVEDYLFLVLGLRGVKELPELTHAHTSPSRARKD